MSRLARVLALICALPVAAAVVVVEWPEAARRVLPDNLAVLLPPPLPAPKPTRAAHWLDQNWSRDDSAWLHHASQGTATLPVPYDWFLALEQPGLSFFAPGLLSDSAYLARMGFNPEARGRTHGGGAIAPSTSLGWSEADNDAGLPVGFARAKIAGEPDRIGLTCAACHTGRIDYGGQSLLIDGGPAALNLNAFERAMSLSIFYTLNVPGRFERFAGRIVGAQAPDAEKARLREDLGRVFDGIVASVRATGAIDAAAGLSDTPEGFFRIDALNRIGNRVFFEDLGGGPELAGNYHAVDAPVRFPALWSTPWFKWAEYDSSIEQPLVRNVGESLGVGARVRFDGVQAFSSSVALDNIVWIEDLLRGPDPFSQARPGFAGLAAPKWPGNSFAGDPAWAVDINRVARGRALYAEICAACHLGPVDDAEFDRLYPDKPFWTAPNWEHGPKGATLALNAYPVAEIGTDSSPGQCAEDAQGGASGRLDAVAPARSRRRLGMRRENRRLWRAPAFCAGVDGHGGACRPQMAGGSPGVGGGQRASFRRAKKLPLSRERAGLSRPAAERRLGHGALSAQWLGPLARPAAAACGAEAQKLLPGRPRLRSPPGRL